MSNKGINYSGAPEFVSGVVISDTYTSINQQKDTLRGRTSVKRILAGYSYNDKGVLTSNTPNLFNLANLAAATATAPSSSLLSSVPDDVFPGFPVQIAYSFGNANGTVITTVGMCGDNIVEDVSPTLEAAANTSYVTSKFFTKVISVSASTAATVFKGSTYQGISGNFPQHAAALDVNSSSGALSLPRATSEEILSFDNYFVGSVGYKLDITPQTYLSTGKGGIPTTYFTQDGCQVFNKTTQAISSKLNGRWIDLYSEDPIKTPTKRIVKDIPIASFLAMVTGTVATAIPVIMAPPAPAAEDLKPGVAAIAVAAINQVILKDLNWTAKSGRLSLTSDGTINCTLTIKGFYNGIAITEQIAFAAAAATKLSRQYSYIESVVCTTLTAAGTLTAITGNQGQDIHVPTRAVLVFENSTVAFTNGGLISLGTSNAGVVTNACLTASNAGINAIAANTAIGIVPFSTNNGAVSLPGTIYLQNSTATVFVSAGNTGKITLIVDYYTIT